MNPIKTRCIFAALVVASTIGWSANKPQDATMPQDILRYVNAYRIQHHLPPLTMNARMSMEAQRHSQDMASHRMHFGHKGFKQRIHRCFQQYHLPRDGAGAENVAYNYKTAKIVVEQWLTSSGHRANIRGHYNETGIGIARDNRGKLYFTEIFLYKA